MPFAASVLEDDSSPRDAAEATSDAAGDSLEGTCLDDGAGDSLECLDDGAGDKSFEGGDDRDLAKVVFACSCCETAHMYAICSIFAYAAFLCVDKGWAADRDRAGYVAGLLGSALAGGRIPVAALWGAAADRFGRRRCIALSMAALAVGQHRPAVARKLRRRRSGE